MVRGTPGLKGGRCVEPTIYMQHLSKDCFVRGTGACLIEQAGEFDLIYLQEAVSQRATKSDVHVPHTKRQRARRCTVRLVPSVSRAVFSFNLLQCGPLHMELRLNMDCVSGTV